MTAPTPLTARANRTLAARANRTLAARDAVHVAHVALTAIAEELRAADGMATVAQMADFDAAAAELRGVLLHAIADNAQEARA